MLVVLPRALCNELASWDCAAHDSPAAGHLTDSRTALVPQLYGQDLRPVAPPYNYAAVSVSNVVATFCQYEALKHVSFPMQVRETGASWVPGGGVSPADCALCNSQSLQAAQHSERAALQSACLGNWVGGAHLSRQPNACKGLLLKFTLPAPGLPRLAPCHVADAGQVRQDDPSHDLGDHHHAQEVW